MFGLLLACGACQRGARTHCSLGEATLVTRDEVTSYDGVALVTAQNDDVYALWSDKLGLFVKSLAAKQSSPLRLGDRCQGGFAAIASGARISVACVRPPGGGEKDGWLELLSVDHASSETRSFARLSALGRDARGVAVAAHDTKHYIAFADGDVGRPRVQLITLDLAAGAGAPQSIALSAPDQNGREPALLIADGVPLVAFAATELGARGARHRLMLSRAGKAAEVLLDVQSTSPLPALAADSEGVVIAFRDVPRPKARSELYLARLDPTTARLKNKARSIGRANGQGGPSLALCKHTRVAAVPIDHAGELYVAFNPLSAQLTTPEANHQYYESEHEFVDSNTACVRGYPLALIAERTEANRAEARLLAAEFRCTQ